MGALTKPAYVKALQDAVVAEFNKVIDTQFQGGNVVKLRPAIWCGSLVVQAVVEKFAPQLRNHYKSAGNALELKVEGKPVRFEPQPAISTTSRTTIRTTIRTTSRTTSAQPASAKDDEKSGMAVNPLWLGILLAGAGTLAIALIVVVILAMKRSIPEDKNFVADEDTEVHHISPTLDEDPYQTHIEMTELVKNKQDEAKPEPEAKQDEAKPEPEAKQDEANPEPEAKQDEAKPEPEAKTNDTEAENDDEAAASQKTVEIMV